MDLDALKKGWNLVLVNGLGHISLNFGLFTALGFALFAKEVSQAASGQGGQG